ncbi:MAG: TadE/TadG family type IV pilus assembly protein [Bryobacteraceae bacterium]
MRAIHPIRSVGSRGQTLLEGVLVLLTLLLVIIGTIDLGRVFFLHQVMTDRAREGARWATVNPFDPGHTEPIRNVVVYDSAVPAGKPALFGLRPEMVTITPLPSSQDVRYIEVQIDFPMNLNTPFLARSFSSRFRAVRLVEGVSKPK